MLTGIFDNSGGKKREATSSNIAVQCCIQQKKKSSFRISSKRKREKKKKANKLLHVTVKRVRKAGTATVSYVTLFPSVFCHPLFPSFISTKIKFFRSNGKKEKKKKKHSCASYSASSTLILSLVNAGHCPPQGPPQAAFKKKKPLLRTAGNLHVQHLILDNSC